MEIKYDYRALCLNSHKQTEHHLIHTKWRTKPIKKMPYTTINTPPNSKQQQLSPNPKQFDCAQLSHLQKHF